MTSEISLGRQIARAFFTCSPSGKNGALTRIDYITRNIKGLIAGLSILSLGIWVIAARDLGGGAVIVGLGGIATLGPLGALVINLLGLRAISKKHNPNETVPIGDL